MEAINNEIITDGPSSTKRARVDLNDSFYDSEEDELVSQACERVSSTKILQESTFVNRDPVCFTPQTPKISTRLYEMPKSATTLKGKPLKTNVTPSLATAIVDENDESVIHTSKPFFRLANEVKELAAERDSFKGQALFLEQSLRAKEKENQDHLQKIAELSQKYTSTLDEVREIQRRSDDEVVHLRTQLQFYEEQKKANVFINDDLMQGTKDQTIDRMTSTPMDIETRLPVTNVLKIKPRMSTSSVNKSFNSALKPKTRTSTNSPRKNDVIGYNEININVLDKEIQTDAFCLKDIITDTNVLSKLEKYDSVLNTMIGSTFIISEIDEEQTDIVKKTADTMAYLMSVDNTEPTLDEILSSKPKV